MLEAEQVGRRQPQGKHQFGTFEDQIQMADAVLVGRRTVTVWGGGMLGMRLNGADECSEQSQSKADEVTHAAAPVKDRTVIL